MLMRSVLALSSVPVVVPLDVTVAPLVVLVATPWKLSMEVAVPMTRPPWSLSCTWPLVAPLSATSAASTSTALPAESRSKKPLPIRRSVGAAICTVVPSTSSVTPFSERRVTVVAAWIVTCLPAAVSPRVMPPSVAVPRISTLPLPEEICVL